jgi:S1-C subfamily serine protease
MGIWTLLKQAAWFAGFSAAVALALLAAVAAGGTSRHALAASQLPPLQTCDPAVAGILPCVEREQGANPPGTQPLSHDDLNARIKAFLGGNGGNPHATVAGIPMPVVLPADSALPPQEVYRRALPSILVVEARNTSSGEQGSVVAVTDKVAITNCHVVMYGSLPETDPNFRYTTIMPQISITDSAGHSGTATVVVAHPEIDICLLQSQGFALRPIAGIEPYSVLQIGAKVYTLGNPKGLTFTFAEGIISQKRPNANLGQGQCADIIQHTGPQSPGSSGGALLDSAGLLVGITESAIPGENLNVAIPVSLLW